MSDDPHDEPIAILDESDPISVINIVPPRIREAAKRSAMSAPHLFTMNEEVFLRHCREESIYFNTTDQMIRDQFWIEYHHARAPGSPKMQLSRILGDAISREGFFSHYLQNNYKVAWLFMMPIKYGAILKRNLTQLARSMSDIIDQPIIDPVTKKFDKGIAQMHIALLKFHEVTLHGTPTQRIEQKTMSLNVTRHEASNINERVVTNNTELLANKIKQLEAREREASHVPKLADWQTMPVTGRDAKPKKDES